MKVQASTVEEFFAAAGEREPDIRELDAFVRKEAPSLKRELHSGMSITMLGYGVFDYKGKSGVTGRWPVAAIAPQKNYISLYICAVVDGQYMAEMYEKELGNVKCGRSCIRFKKLQDLNLATVGKILKDIEARMERGEKPFGI